MTAEEYSRRTGDGDVWGPLEAAPVGGSAPVPEAARSPTPMLRDQAKAPPVEVGFSHSGAIKVRVSRYVLI